MERILVHGPDAFAASEVHNRVKAACAEHGVEPLGVQHVDDNTAAAAAVSAAEASLFGARVITGQLGDNSAAEALLCCDLADDCTVIIQFTGKPSAAWRKLAGVTVIDPPATRTQAQRVTAQRAVAAAHGVTLDKAAAAAAQRRFGADLDAFGAALKELAGGDTQAGHVPNWGRFEAPTPPPWALTDAIESGDIAAALTALDALCASKSWPPVRVVAVLAARYMAAHGVAHGAAAQPGWVGQQATGVARRWGPERLQRAYMLIAQAEHAARSGGLLGNNASLELVVARLAHLAR